MNNQAVEREDKELTATEEIRLIKYLEKIGWTSNEIIKLIKAIRA